MRSLIIVAALALSGCSINPELIQALAKDDASICIYGDARGGVGTLMTPGGGYGQGTTIICRSKFPDAALSVQPDGSITIQHGKGISE